MKKFGKILAAAFAFAALGLASCDHDYSVSQIKEGQPSAILTLENATKATYTATYTNADDEEKTAAVVVKDGKVTVDGTVVATYEVYYDGKAKILTTPASGWTVELKDDGSLKTLKKGDTTYNLESTSESSGTSGKGASVDAAWDFSSDSLVSEVTGNSAWNSGKPTADIAVTATSGKNATFTLVKQSSGTVKLESSVLKLPNNDTVGKSAVKYATLTVDGDCTVKISGKAGGKSNSNVSRSLAVGGKTYTQASGQTSGDAFTLEFSATKGTTYEFVAMGVNISSITCE